MEGGRTTPAEEAVGDGEEWTVVDESGRMRRVRLLAEEDAVLRPPPVIADARPLSDLETLSMLIRGG